MVDASPRWEDRAALLHNLWLRLGDAGDAAGALMAIREAVEIYRPLAQENPARFAADLAVSLGNLSILLRRGGDETGADDATREAAEWRARQQSAESAG